MPIHVEYQLFLFMVYAPIKQMFTGTILCKQQFVQTGQIKSLSLNLWWLKRRQWDGCED